MFAARLLDTRPGGCCPVAVHDVAGGGKRFVADQWAGRTGEVPCRTRPPTTSASRPSRLLLRDVHIAARGLRKKTGSAIDLRLCR
jgi:hypothetical protein